MRVTIFCRVSIDNHGYKGTDLFTGISQSGSKVKGRYDNENGGVI